ncbi:MAG TPA: DUF3175 domain-containing protein [Methylocella sp.]|nr:DUF3175 domain-containing protein [Methylocella sp.]
MIRKSANPLQQGGKLNSQADNKTQSRYWSAAVTRQSNALDLEMGVFTWRNPVKIAKSLKHSAEASTRRKGTPYQSAMSMLNFYVNRAGRNLPQSQKRILEEAKSELRKLFNRRTLPNEP